MPSHWIGLRPLLDAALTQNELAEAVAYAQNLRRPEMTLLPGEVMAVLKQAIITFADKQSETTRDCLQAALR